MNVIALQDGDHRIIDSAGQWMIQHRTGPGKVWHNDAFCVTRHGIEFFLAGESQRYGFNWMQDGDGHPVRLRPLRLGFAEYLPLHHWTDPPSLPSFHPG